MEYEMIQDAVQQIEENRRQYEIILTGLVSSRLELFEQKNENQVGVFEIVCFNDSHNYPKKIKCFNLTLEGGALLAKYIQPGNRINLRGDLRESRYSKEGELKKNPNIYYVPKYLIVALADSEKGVSINFTEEFIRNKNLPPKNDDNQKESEEKIKIKLQQDSQQSEELSEESFGLDFGY